VRVVLRRLNFAVDGCVGICRVSPDDRKHPNKMPFSGTLLVVDSPSNKPPHGSQGHRILVPKAVAQKRLNSLIDMGLNYLPGDLDGHAPRHKVGIITGAWIEGKNVKVKGFLWKKDFPEVVRDLHSGKLGMSMELADVYVRSKDEDVWYLEDFHFSGATVLLKTAAAYYATALAAAAVSSGSGGKGMKHKEKAGAAANRDDQGALLVNALSASIGPAISKAIAESMKPVIQGFSAQQAAISRMAASVEELKVVSIEAAKHDEDDDDEEEDMDATGHEEDDDMDADGDDDDDDDDEDDGKKHKGDDDDDDDDDDADLDAEMEHLDGDPGANSVGEVNKDAKNMGDKKTVTGKTGKSKSMPTLDASGRKVRTIQSSSVIRELYASHRALRTKYRTLRASAQEKIGSLENKVEALEAQIENYAAKVDRRSVAPELGTFLAKNNIDVRELRAEGRKLSVHEVDTMFASSPVNLDPTTRMWFKNQLLEQGLMETGEIHRTM
jgi:hypothetical protein